MKEISILSNYGRPITYFGVAYTLSKEDNDRLHSTDAIIQERLRDVIYFAPNGSRHITIMNITSVAEGHKDQDTMRFFKDNVRLYRDRLKTIASSLEPFEVKFTHLQAGAGAVFCAGRMTVTSRLYEPSLWIYLVLMGELLMPDLFTPRRLVTKNNLP